ncbi:MAG: DUF4249 family protein [Bacteroidota bacterium]
MSVRVMIAWLMCLLMIACEEAIDLPLASQELTTLVVEGILTNEKINHRIKLSHPYGIQNGNAVPASGAVVNIMDGTDSISLTEFPSGSGEYYTPQVRAVFGKTYTLLIQYQGKEYLAQDSSVPVEPLQPLDYRKVEDFYTLNLFEAGQNASFISHDISWKNTTFCSSGVVCEGKVVFYDLKTIDVNEIYKPGKEEFRFPLNSIVVRKKYSVSPAYKAFLRSVLSETEWRGGIFDVQRGNATTNLNEGAIGFFAVSTVLSDSTLIVDLP